MHLSGVHFSDLYFINEETAGLEALSNLLKIPQLGSGKTELEARFLRSQKKNYNNANVFWLSSIWDSKNLFQGKKKKNQRLIQRDIQRNNKLTIINKPI